MTWLEPAGGRAQGSLEADGKTTTSPSITGDTRKGVGLKWVILTQCKFRREALFSLALGNNRNTLNQHSHLFAFEYCGFYGCALRASKQIADAMSCCEVHVCGRCSAATH